MIIEAHRGGVGPPNSMASFGRCLELGLDAIEFDIHLSSDGEIFCLHGKNGNIGHDYPEHNVSADTPIKEMDSELLSKLRPFGERIPKFEDVIELCKLTKTRLNIDIKTTQVEIVEPMLEILDYHKFDR